LVGLVSF